MNKRSNRGAFDPDDLDPVDAIRRETGMARPTSAGQGKHQKRNGYAHKSGSGGRTQAASARSLTAAEHWIAAGIRAGVENPSNAAWLSHRIQTKVTRDPEMRPYLDQDLHEQVQRWLAKMADLYWSEYFYEKIKPNEAVFDFLEEAWDDVRDYAKDCLRAAYLKEHGVRVPAPEYKPREEQEMQQALSQQRFNEWVQSVRDSEKIEVDRPSLDSEHRAMLRSAVQRNQQRREEDA